LIDSKFEPLTKRKMKDYLGEMEDDDLIMFVVEHLKDHKGPAKLVEGLEPVCIHSSFVVSLLTSYPSGQVLVEEAEEFVILLWRQVVFESIAYAEGLETEDILLA
jgi:RNA-binding protein 25